MAFRPGFSDEWRDEVDYILGITDQIWEHRNIHRLKEWYGPDLIVRSPAGVVQGNAGIIAATMATLAEFPDRELPGEDVIWCDTGPDSFLSSHRLLCRATHTGPGVYGAPTGRVLTYRILADCWCKDNGVQDEWLVRDQAAIVRQMGCDVVDWTRDLIANEGGPERCVLPFTPTREIPGPYTGTGNNTPPGVQAEALLQAIMSGEFSAISTGYDPAASLHYPGHMTGIGPKDADQFWLGLRTSFPSAKFQIDHSIGREDPQQPLRAAVRWSLHGRHDGHGRFGGPTGAEVYVMGISHFEFGPRGVRAEWTLIDDTAIWKQILLAQGATG